VSPPPPPHTPLPTRTSLITSTHHDMPHPTSTDGPMYRPTGPIHGPICNRPAAQPASPGRLGSAAPPGWAAHRAVQQARTMPTRCAGRADLTLCGVNERDGATRRSLAVQFHVLLTRQT
jgi:hypothetical protein